MEHPKYGNVGPNAEHIHGCISVISGVSYMVRGLQKVQYLFTGLMD
jgi:hypothetical protein